jgi:DNA-binding PucR family transcriptional regulator
LTRVAGIIHLHKRIAEILRALGDHSLNLCMGISNIFSDLRDIRDHKEQADYALEICNTGEDISHKFYINCVITRIKEIVSKNIPAKSFIHPSVNLLREYDAKNNTNYTETLLSYVTSGGNVKKCVHELHIHRNTLIYRLKVIENLTDLNLQDAETVALLGMNFYLSG